MFRKAMLAAACAAFVCVGCGETDGPVDANEALTEASTAMGADSVESITYSGSAKRARNSFLQTPSASPPWPTHDVNDYRRTIDFTQPASRATGNEFHGGLFMGPPMDTPFNQNITPQQAAWGQQLEIWLTPWGFLRGARMNNAEAESQMVDGTRYTIVTWMTPEPLRSPSGMPYTVKGYINDQNLVEMVETWVEDQIMGDLHVRNVYSDYRDFDGVMVPTRMVQERAGGSVFEVTVEDASANPTNLAELITPPAPPGGGGPGGGGRGGRAGGPGGPGGGRGAAAAPTELAQKAGDGVYLIGGGYVALAVEFTDHVAVFEGGQSPARGQQILDEVKRVIPNKPIRYIINSHPHSDHSLGLVPFLRDGATLITHSNNVEFLEMAFTTPRTLLGEEPLMPTIEGVDEMRVLEDSMNRLELHSVPNDHTDGMLVAYLPKQKILFQADFTLPQPGQTANPFVVALAERVQELNLDFDRYLAVHAAQQPQTKNDLMAVLKQ